MCLQRYLYLSINQINMKEIKLTHEQLTSLIKGMVLEYEEKMTPRDLELKDMFGKYSEEVPSNVIQYIRKNPRKIITTLMEIYGEEMIEYMMTNTNRTLDKYTVDEIRESKKFIQKAEKDIEKKGTKGKFGSWCKSQGLDDDGEVTMKCIDKGLKSDKPSVVKMANFAKNIKGYKGSKH